jgi:hypothetical protein
MPRKKIVKSKRVKKTEADLLTFKLIINNQGQFVIEKSIYPRDKINLHFKKENAGLIHAMFRESETYFDNLTQTYELLLKELS